MGNVTQLAVPVLGDFCAIYVLPTPDAKFPAVQFTHRDPDVVEHLRRLVETYGSGGGADTIVARVMRTAQPVFVQRVDDENIERFDIPAEVREVVRRFGFSSVMTVPLIKNRRIVGVLQFVNTEGSRSYTQADLALAMAIASRVASTLENRRLAEQQREIAMTLQASLLPSMLPEIPGVDVAVRYWAAGEGTAVGGDSTTCSGSTSGGGPPSSATSAAPGLRLPRSPASRGTRFARRRGTTPPPTRYLPS